MIPENITREHVLKAIREIDSLEKIPYHRGSVNYDLYFEGKRYPPKYVISLANKYANGHALDSNDFNAIEAKTFLPKLAFEIKLKFDIKPGDVIGNQQLSTLFSVGTQGGMRKSNKTNTLVLISDQTKPFYKDEWDGDIFHYTGMGISGDQDINYAQNKTLTESNTNGIEVHLFEVFSPGKYTYQGIAQLAGTPYEKIQKDKDGNERKVVIFPLKLKTFFPQLSDSIIIAGIGGSSNGWKGFEYQDIKLDYIPREAWNFFNFDSQYYYGSIGDKNPAKFKNGGLILLFSTDPVTKKRVMVGYYGDVVFDKFSLPIDIGDTIQDEQIRHQFKEKFSDQKYLEYRTSRNFKADKTLSTIFTTPIEFELAEFDIKNWKQAPFMYIGDTGAISKNRAKKLVMKALSLHKEHYDKSSDDREKKELQDIITKTQTVLEMYFSDEEKRHYWQIAPREQAKDWDLCVKEGIIPIYFNEYFKNAPDEVLTYNKEQLKTYFRSNYTESTVASIELISAFINGIQIGDYILANKGRSTALGWGIVTSEPKFYPGDSDITIYREVDWKNVNLNKTLTNEQGKNFFKTIYQMTKEHFDSIVNPEPTSYWGLLSGIVNEVEKQEYWSYFKEKNVIGIGCTDYIEFIEKYGQNVLQFDTKEKYEQAFREIYPKKVSRFIWDLIYEVNIGDIIIVSKGRQAIIAEGIVKSIARVDLNSHCRIIRDVEWKTMTPNIPLTGSFKGKFSNYIFKLTPEEYHQIMGQIIPEKNTFKKQVILYGPPGTGKTYTSVIKAHEIIFGENDSKITYRTLQDKLRSQQKNEIDVSQLSWLQAIVLAFDEISKEKVQVDEIKKSRIIQEFSSYKNNRSIGNTIWFVLQTESRLDSDTVRSQKKSGREYFDKDTESNWFLTEKGKEYQRILIEDLNELQQTSDFQFSFITFHQSFSYEDFVEGIRPELDSTDDSTIVYRIKDGIFKEICNKAADNPGNNYVLVIDEINRGNISKIFGELITLLEDNKRGGESEEITVRLPYSKKDFSVPTNVYIIGTMNSTDKSIALVDIALRRRFHFERLNVNYEMIPNEDARAFLEELNKSICAIKNPDYEIGHSYFMKIPETDNENLELKNVFTNQILPLLEEYFFNDWEALATILGRDSIKIEERKKFVWNEDMASFEDDGGDYDTVYGRCLKEPDIVFTNTLKNLQKQNTNKQEINP